MNRSSRQHGMTLISFVIVLIVVGIGVFIGIKLFPVYSEYYSVVQAMKGVQAEAGIASKPPEEVRQALTRRFYVSYVKSVKPEHIKISRQNGYNLTVKYEVREPLVYNLDFVARFEKTVDLARSGID